MKSNVDLYLNADRTQVVLEDDPAAAFLLVNAGREIPDGEMAPEILSQAQKVGSDKPVEDKSVRGPARANPPKKATPEEPAAVVEDEDPEGREADDGE